MLTLGTPGVCLKQKQEVTWSVQMVVGIWSDWSQLAMKLDEDSEEMKLRVTKLVYEHCSECGNEETV